MKKDHNMLFVHIPPVYECEHRDGSRTRTKKLLRKLVAVDLQVFSLFP